MSVVRMTLIDGSHKTHTLVKNINFYVNIDVTKKLYPGFPTFKSPKNLLENLPKMYSCRLDRYWSSAKLGTNK